MNLKLIVLLFLFTSVNVFAQKTNSAWTNLYNGKDLSGWRLLGGKATYEAKGDEIIGTTVSNTPNSFLATEQEYGDFILEVELLAHPLMNSGIQFRSLSNSEYQNGRVHGYQMEIDPSARAWSGGVYDEGRRGWLYNLELNPAAKTAYKINDWNKYRIECIGNSIRTWVNGIPVSNLVDDMTRKGFIAMQVHSIPSSEPQGRQIRWKNIRLQTENLKPSPPDNIFVVNMVSNDMSALEKKQGYRLLWDGKTSKGWTSANGTAFPAEGWQIQDGILSIQKDIPGEKAKGGDIVSEKEFSAYELKFDFKLTKGANSGLKYFASNLGGSVLGLEYQILDDENHPDAKLGIKGNRTQASLYDIIPAQKIPYTLKKVGEWNQGMIRVYPDNKVEHWLNGLKVLEYQRGSADFMENISRSKFKAVQGFGTAAKGKILLQDHGDKVFFRSIKIKELK